MNCHKEMRAQIYYYAWSIMLFYNLSTWSELNYTFIGSKVFRGLVYLFISAVLFVKMILFDKYKTNMLCIYLLVGFFLILCAHNSSSSGLLITVAFLVSSQGINFRKFIKYDLYVRLTCVLLLLLLSLSGVINMFNDVINGSEKYAFGWLHPNTFGGMVIQILLEWLYLSRMKINKKKNTIIVVVIVFLFVFCESRTQIYTFLVVYVAIIATSLYKKINHMKIVRFLYLWIMPLTIVLSILPVQAYMNGNPLAIMLNEVFTGRIGLSASFISRYGISIFGQTIPTISIREAMLIGQKSDIFDMAYPRMAVEYGIIVFVMFIFGYIILQKKLLKFNLFPELLLIAYFAIIGLGTTGTTSLFTNCTIILLLNHNAVIDCWQNKVVAYKRRIVFTIGRRRVSEGIMR